MYEKVTVSLHEPPRLFHYLEGLLILEILMYVKHRRTEENITKIEKYKW